VAVRCEFEEVIDSKQIHLPCYPDSSLTKENSHPQRVVWMWVV
jgi:hypothetical protein